MLPLFIRIRDGFSAMLTVDKVIHHAGLQRPRTKQRHQSDDVFKTVGLQSLNQLFHTARFELEYRGGFGILQVTERARIVERDRFNPHGGFARLFQTRVH
ncbi:Uncharacterised protein [Vibrio cholerae]|uniref:Uncharacterized protein n=1 Tax=Vibrio cholerae TaxID=666 RepID=A0A655YLZ7_VIBCL|nr:Uncharacterised protein [Vibrio cholerae]CSA23135.1 Uncharacterised protein [Vibrio cholerae]CSC38655.1 Uncharacterised protein [Vibrio cholerae]CSC45928.1 Uncharacterised protein [Vibrio cholerae]CSC77498.1 Uncharacterised protein [Vibrio cholerae]